MGKVKRVKQNGAVTEPTVKTEQDYDTGDTSVDDIEERVRRIEAAQAGGFSDVYKFAFFFFMGIALTLAVYPNIARTVESGSQVRESTTPQIKTDDRAYAQEYDLDDTGIGKHHDKSVSEQTVQEQSKEVQRETEHAEQTSKVKKHVQHAKDNDIDKTEVPVRGKKEDVMIGEESETTIETVDDMSAEQHANSAEERVEILTLNSEDVAKMSDRNKVESKSNDAKSQKSSNSKLKRPSSKSSKQSNASKGKLKSKSKATQEKPSGDKKQEVPDEVKNFKPTFLKGVTPKKIFADGRRIPPMELLPQKPNNSSVKVWLFEEFLSEEECDGLMRVQNKHIEEQSKDDPILCFDTISTLRKHLKNVGKTVTVTPMDFTEGTTCVNASFSSQLKEWFNGNWSYSTAFYPGESRFASIFEQRVKQATGLLPENGGKFQITSYPEEIGYKTHTDCTESADKRDRVATILVYLDTVTEGGETEFPELGIWVRPRKARALVWNNMNDNGECEPMSVHKAAKVGKGQRKYILQRWYYYQSFYSLGKRPPEPPLPARKPNQARVSCDEYEKGSCRWYDEWDFSHILEYQKRKYTLI